MKYEEIELLKQSEKSSVHLVRKEDGDQVFIQKILKGQHHIYSVLLTSIHTCRGFMKSSYLMNLQQLLKNI